jgi:hypothetical protein
LREVGEALFLGDNIGSGSLHRTSDETLDSTESTSSARSATEVDETSDLLHDSHCYHRVESFVTSYRGEGSSQLMRVGRLEIEGMEVLTRTDSRFSEFVER